MRKVLLFTPVVLGACATQPTVPVSIDQVPPGSTCTQSSVLDSFVGQPATAEVGARLLAASRARTLRWVAKGMMVTMEYRADRLTVWLDANNRIERVTCG
jgi:hypothetical protein